MIEPMRVTVTAADNGLIIDWVDDDDDGNPWHHHEVFEWREEDLGELPAWQEMFFRLLEILGGPIGSKHDQKRLVVDIVEKGEEGA